MSKQLAEGSFQRFLVRGFAGGADIVLMPLYFIMRSNMGVAHTALFPILFYVAVYGGAVVVFAFTGEMNAMVTLMFAVLAALGYYRNAGQARERRRLRDWSVHSGSCGTSLLIPLFEFAYPRLHRMWAAKRPSSIRWLELLKNEDFVYYVGEPATLLLAAIGIWSIGSSLWFVLINLAISLILLRADRKLYYYLKAHEIVDGRMFEGWVREELEMPGPKATGIPVAQSSPAPSIRLATDAKSVFNRLSPELQNLLARDWDRQ